MSAGGWGEFVPAARCNTLPLVARDGEGVADDPLTEGNN